MQIGAKSGMNCIAFSHIDMYNINRESVISNNIPAFKMIIEYKNQDKKGYADIRKNDIYDE